MADWLLGNESKRMVDLRRVHAPARKHQLAQLQADFAVVENERCLACRIVSTANTSSSEPFHLAPSSLAALPRSSQGTTQPIHLERTGQPTLHKRNNLSRAPAHLAQSTSDALRSAGNGRPRGRRDARQALARLGRVLGSRLLRAVGSLLCLLLCVARGGAALESASGNIAERVGGRAPHQRACEGGRHSRWWCLGPKGWEMRDGEGMENPSVTCRRVGWWLVVVMLLWAAFGSWEDSVQSRVSE